MNRREKRQWWFEVLYADVRAHLHNLKIDDREFVNRCQQMKTQAGRE